MLNTKSLALALVLAGSAIAPASAATILKFSHNTAETTATHLGALKFKELVEARTKGDVEVQIYPNSALGDDVEVAQQMQFGAIQAAPIPTAKLSNFVPAMQLIDLPFLFPSVEITHKVLDSEAVGGALLGKLADSGLTGAAFWEAGFKQLTCNHRVAMPDDLAGHKVRVMESPLLIRQFEALGASAIPVAFTETYSALQQGLVECQENPIVAISSMKFYEVQKFMMLTNHGYLATALVFSKVWFDALPKETQDILMTAAHEAAVYERQKSEDMDAALLKGIRDAGTTEIVEMTPEEIAAFSEKMKPVHAEFADKIGADLLQTTYKEIDALAE